MSQPADQDNRSRPRVVLLATDRSQSIIGEIVDGQSQTIVYSAYGEQSAQQKIETRLGSMANCVKPTLAGTCWATAIAPTTHD